MLSYLGCFALIQSRGGLSESVVLMQLICSIFPHLAVLSLGHMPLLRTAWFYPTPHWTPYRSKPPGFHAAELSSPLSLVYWSLTPLQYRLAFPKMYLWQYSHRLLISLMGKNMVHDQITLRKPRWTQPNGFLFWRAFWESVLSQPDSQSPLGSVASSSSMPAPRDCPCRESCGSCLYPFDP